MIVCSEEQIREYMAAGWWGDKTLTDLFFENVKKSPHQTAVVDPSNREKVTSGQPFSLTYEEMAKKVDNLAAGLIMLGIKKDDVVMIQLPNIVELACVYLALARIGAIASPLAVQYRTHELRHTMKITEPKAFITAINCLGFNSAEMVKSLQPEFPSLKSIIALGGDPAQGYVSLEELINGTYEQTILADYLSKHSISANDVFTICWTSGTEAEPKGVPRSHNHWISIGKVLVEGCEMDPGCNILSPFPFINMAAIGGLFFPWVLTGGKFVLHHPLDLKVFLSQVGTEQINYTVVPPAILNMLLQTPDLIKHVDLSTIKSIGSGSAPLSPWMVKEYQEQHNIRVINIFGSNEGVSLVSSFKDFSNPEERAQYFPRWGVSGLSWQVSMANQMKTKLVDPISKKVIEEQGVSGEMCIKGPAVFAGYYKRPDLTAKSFDSEGYFNTGDLFAIEGEEGNLNRYLFCGRSKDLIIRGGMNISPEELEYLIIEHPKVSEVAVVGYQDQKLGEKICAVVVPAKDQNISITELVQFLKQKDIAVYKLPEKVLAVEGLPRNPVGKVLKRELKALAEQAG